MSVKMDNMAIENPDKETTVKEVEVIDRSKFQSKIFSP